MLGNRIMFRRCRAFTIDNGLAPKVSSKVSVPTWWRLWEGLRTKLLVMVKTDTRRRRK